MNKLKTKRMMLKKIFIGSALSLGVLSGGAALMTQNDMVTYAESTEVVGVEDYSVSSEVLDEVNAKTFTHQGVEYQTYELISDNALDPYNNTWYLYAFKGVKNSEVAVLGYVIFPKSVNTNGTLTIPATVNAGSDYAINYVGTKSFKDTNCITSLNFEMGITVIEAYAFENCGVSSVSFPESICSLYEGAFANNDNLVTFTFPAGPGFKQTGNKMLYDCNNLTTVTLPNNIQCIDAETFYNCNKLTGVELPDGLQVILYRAFARTGLTEINFKNVTYIAAQTFEHCYNLTTIDWGNCKFQNKLDYRTFYMCNSLTEIKVPDNVLCIGTDCFNGCTSVSTIDLNKTEAIEYCAFANTGITSLEIPECVKSMGAFAFGNTPNLTEVTFKNDIGIYISDNSAPSNQLFIEFGKLTYNENYDSWSNDGGAWKNDIIKVINIDNANTNCDTVPVGMFQFMGVEEVNLSDNIVTIGYQAFKECKALKNINMNKINAIQENAFQCCTSLAEINPTEDNKINFPDTLYWIDNQAFFECSSMENVTLDKNIFHIGNGCFYNAGIKNLRIEKNVTEVGESAFKELTQCETIYVDVPLESFNSSDNYSYMAVFWNSCNLDTLTIGNSIKELDDNCLNHMYTKHLVFEDGSEITELPYHSIFGCAYLESVVLPENLETISNEAFQSCYSLKSLELPDTVKTIKQNAFFNCHSLETINLDNVETIGNHAFFNNLNLKEVYISENIDCIGIAAFYNTYGLEKVTIDNKYMLNAETKETIFKDADTLSTTPQSYIARAFGRDDREQNHGGVASHLDFDKASCTPEHSYFELVFTDKVEELKEYDCEGMYIGKVTIQDNGKLSNIPYMCFSNCQYLEEVNFGSNTVNTLDDYAFVSCSSLNNVELPMSVTNVGEYAFSGCDALEQIYLWNPDIMIEDYEGAGLKHATEIVDGGGISKYSENIYDVSGAEEVVITYYIYTSRSIPDGDLNTICRTPEKWLIEETEALDIEHNLSLTNLTLLEEGVVKNNYDNIVQTNIYSLDDVTQMAEIQFTNPKYVYSIMSSSQSINSENGKKQLNISIVVSKDNATIPYATDIYAYRYTKDGWSIPGYNHEDEIDIYSETSPMTFVDSCTTKRNTYAGRLYPLDEMITIDGTVAKPNQLKGAEYEKFGITVDGTRRDGRIIGLEEYTNNYDNTDLTLGDRDVELQYICPVSLVNGAPSDIVVVTICDERKVTISGALQYSNNSPIANKTIRLERDINSQNSPIARTLLRAANDIFTYETTTDEKGAFEFTEIPVGAYKLSIYNDVEKDDVLASVDVYVQNVFNEDDTKTDEMDVTDKADNVETQTTINANLFNIDATLILAPPTEEPTTEATTEATTEVTTEATTEVTTEATTEVTTEATTEVTTEATTEVTTEVTTEATTEVTTEATTEVTTEMTTEATTEEKVVETPKTGDAGSPFLAFTIGGLSSMAIVFLGFSKKKKLKDN